MTAKLSACPLSILPAMSPPLLMASASAKTPSDGRICTPPFFDQTTASGPTDGFTTSPGTTRAGGGVPPPRFFPPSPPPPPLGRVFPPPGGFSRFIYPRRSRTRSAPAPRHSHGSRRTVPTDYCCLRDTATSQ